MVADRRVGIGASVNETVLLQEAETFQEVTNGNNFETIQKCNFLCATSVSPSIAD